MSIPAHLDFYSLTYGRRARRRIVTVIACARDSKSRSPQGKIGSRISINGLVLEITTS